MPRDPSLSGTNDEGNVETPPPLLLVQLLQLLLPPPPRRGTILILQPPFSRSEGWDFGGWGPDVSGADARRRHGARRGRLARGVRVGVGAKWIWRVCSSGGGGDGAWDGAGAGGGEDMKGGGESGQGGLRSVGQLVNR